jgi:tetratricopeptide (TPR) repeat protein
MLLAGAAAPALAQYENASRAAPAPTQTEQPEGEQTQQVAGSIKPSKGAMKAIIDLQKAVNANDQASIPSKLAAAQAVATTPEDKYLVAQFQLKIAAAKNDLAGVSSAVETIAASGKIDNQKVGALYRGLGGSFYNAKQYDQAAAAFTRAVALNSGDLESLKLIGEAQLAQGKKPEAAATFQKVLAARSAAGQKAEEDLYKRAVQLAYDSKSANATQLAREWVAAYPSADSWHNAIAIYRNLNQPDVEGTLSLLRLMRAAKAMTTPGDYALYAAAAADQRNYNEAQVVIDEGIAAKVVDPASPRFKDIIVPLKTKPIATAADLATASKTAATGAALLGIGDRYYALGDYAKAVEAYKAARAKGADAEVANMHIGMALTAAGDKAGAAQAFNSVKGGRAAIAQYWLLYLQGRA